MSYMLVANIDDEWRQEALLSSTEEEQPKTIHPEARALFNRFPWTRNIPVFGLACEGFGVKYTFALATCYLLCKGLADYILKGANFAMFTDRFGIEVMRYQRLQPIAMAAFSIKPFTAMLCDTFAFLGYTRRWYMFISCVAGAAFALAYALLPAAQSSANPAAAFVFLTSFGKVNVDILSQGHYSRLMRKFPLSGPALLSWIWWFITIGSLISGVVTGPLGDAKIPQVSIFISAGLQFITCFIFVFNLYSERVNSVERAEDHAIIQEEIAAERARLLIKNANNNNNNNTINDVDDFEINAITEMGKAPGKNYHPELPEGEIMPTGMDGNEYQLPLTEELQMNYQQTQHNSHGCMVVNEMTEFVPPPKCLCGIFEYNKEVVDRNWRVLVFSCVMTAAVVAILCANILANKLGLLIVAVCVAVVACGTSFWALPRLIAKVTLFAFLSASLYWQIPGPVDAFYMAKPDCLLDGPHFTYTFYNTIASVIGNIASLAGVVLFTYLFSKKTYWFTFIVTTIIRTIASVFDIVIVKRWNIAIGIPDHAMYICGDTIIFQLCYMLEFMPLALIMSRLCPRGSESSVYAILAGIANLGQTMSSAIGAIVMEYAWPIKSKGVCDFSNLPWLLLVGHMICPLIIIPLSVLLLPRVKVCDDIDIDGNVIKKKLNELNAKKPNISGDDNVDTSVEKEVKHTEPTQDAFHNDHLYKAGGRE